VTIEGRDHMPVPIAGEKYRWYVNPRSSLVTGKNLDGATRVPYVTSFASASLPSEPEAMSYPLSFEDVSSTAANRSSPSFAACRSWSRRPAGAFDGS
jgi:hypothetical protein